MDRYYSLEHNPDAIPPNDTIHCLTFGCRMQVASFNDDIPMSRSRGIGLFNSVLIYTCMINVDVPDNVSNHLGTTVANIYCSQCDKMIGWKIIAVTQPSKYITEGRFCMRFVIFCCRDKLSFLNCVLMILSIQEQNFWANEENADQDADTTDGDGDSNDRDLGANDQNDEQDLGANDQNDEQGLGANEQNVDQDGDSTDQDGDTADQGLGANEQNVDQDGDSDEEYDGAISSYLMHFLSQNANQDGDANEQNADQVVGANERNADQHGVGNEQNHDQDEDLNEQNVDQVVGANEQNADQHAVGNEQNQVEDRNEQTADQL
ncbi:hypothetical protein R3W88_018277 [Solanum pinnatisectum]|uniref:Yippee domain-containing protein n=1 Tax=Solanum pinnatisectum TaxID=50273 RepID=A0AAV9L311_9SOLN|nr:hypothetical protein R3W88_018277 [Solanum pinnatisectum]